jgi:hypothetical protein
MSRTNPDPVFAAAARAELERRVGSSSAAPVRRRPWVMELTAVAGVLLLVGGIAVGVTALRPALDAGGAPVGSTTQSPTSTSTPTTTPTPDPSATPDVPASTAVPTSPAATAPPTRSTTTTAPAAPVPTAPATTPPATTGTSALVGPTGAQQRSAAEIRAWAASVGNSDVWAEQAVLDTSCMAEHGFLYDPEFDSSAGLAAQKVGLTAAQYQAFQDAYYGPQTGAAYDWRTAGCHGRSVHLTGQDDAN